jgi:hypothetical protein
MSHQPLEIELLVPPDRRVTIAGHHEFREGLRGCTDDDDLDGDIDEASTANPQPKSIEQ